MAPNISWGGRWQKDGFPVGEVVGILVDSFACSVRGAFLGNSDCSSVGLDIRNDVGGVVGDLVGD